jgi:hypothetical protein
VHTRFRLSALILVLAAVASCDSEPTAKCSDEPPAIVMQTREGDQVGVQGSYCVSAGGCGVCADRFVEPEVSTVVRPGDEITFSMPGGTLVSGTGCHPACPPTLRIESATCHPGGAGIRSLSEDRPWSVDLDPGSYRVWIDSNFEADDGLTGQIHTGFGLKVVSSSSDPSTAGADCDGGMSSRDAG